MRFFVRRKMMIVTRYLKRTELHLSRTGIWSQTPFFFYITQKDGTWDAVIPDVHCGVGKECFLVSLHGDNRWGFKDGESGSRHRGGESFLRRSASSSPSVLSSTMICGSPTPLPVLELVNCLLILFQMVYSAKRQDTVCQKAYSIFKVCRFADSNQPRRVYIVRYNSSSIIRFNSGKRLSG